MARITFSRAMLPLILLCGALAACHHTGSPDLPVISTAEVDGLGFKHLVRLSGKLRRAPLVHVYLEGDGRPFSSRHQPARDPTPHRALALELMALDDTPSIYLGRPCYHGRAAAPGCGTALWTTDRYGIRVIESMQKALNALHHDFAFEQVALIGYSGGGTLAMLMAGDLPYVQRVVTLAGNLDIAAWTSLHEYSPLTGSLNPAHRPALPRRIAQDHYAGARDRNVPAALISAAIAQQYSAHYEVLPGVDHRDGWTSAWPSILKKIARVPPTTDASARSATAD